MNLQNNVTNNNMFCLNFNITSRKEWTGKETLIDITEVKSDIKKDEGWMQYGERYWNYVTSADQSARVAPIVDAVKSFRENLGELNQPLKISEVINCISNLNKIKEFLNNDDIECYENSLKKWVGNNLCKNTIKCCNDFEVVINNENDVIENILSLNISKENYFTGGNIDDYCTQFNQLKKDGIMNFIDKIKEISMKRMRFRNQLNGLKECLTLIFENPVVINAQTYSINEIQNRDLINKLIDNRRTMLLKMEDFSKGFINTEQRVKLKFFNSLDNISDKLSILKNLYSSESKSLVEPEQVYLKCLGNERIKHLLTSDKLITIDDINKWDKSDFEVLGERSVSANDVQTGKLVSEILPTINKKLHIIRNYHEVLNGIQYPVNMIDLSDPELGSYIKVTDSIGLAKLINLYFKYLEDLNAAKKNIHDFAHFSDTIETLQCVHDKFVYKRLTVQEKAEYFDKLAKEINIEAKSNRQDMIITKKKLIENYINSNCLDSSRFRNYLFSLLKQTNITTAEISKLETLADEELEAVAVHLQY